MTSPSDNIEWTLLAPNELPTAAREFKAAFDDIVIGQEQAQAVALSAFERANNPLRDPTKPIGAYLLVGPSRTGKTLTAKAVARLFHKSDDALTIIEAGDYIEKHQMLDLTGATPTYIGYKSPEEIKRLDPSDVDPSSKLSAHNLRRVRRNSESNVDIICINEFEKGCDEFFRFWMGALDNGFIIHGNGIKTSLRNAIVFYTSNLAMDQVEKLARGGTGFTSKPTVVGTDEVKMVVDEAIKEKWPPEFRNRLTSVVIFRPLTAAEILMICGVELKDVQNRINTQLEKNAFPLEVTTAARQWLVDEAFKGNGNVAQLKRIVETQVAEKIGREWHKGTIRGATRVVIDVSDDKLSLVFKSARLLIPEPPADAPPGKTFEYRLQQAKAGVRRGKVPTALFRIWLMTDSADEAGRFRTQVDNDLPSVFDVRPVDEYHHKVEPFVISKSVRTSAEMAALIEERLKRTFPESAVDIQS